MISAEVMRALRTAGYAEEARAMALEGLLTWLVQHRQTSFELAIDAQGRWRARGRWPGPDPGLEAEGRSAADALAKIVLDVIAREGPPQPTSR